MRSGRLSGADLVEWRGSRTGVAAVSGRISKKVSAHQTSGRTLQTANAGSAPPRSVRGSPGGGSVACELPRAFRCEGTAVACRSHPVVFVIRASQGSILETSPRRSVKSSPASPRQQPGRQARAFSHSLGQELTWDSLRRAIVCGARLEAVQRGRPRTAAEQLSRHRPTPRTS
jgi:hypothetical protein